MPGLYLLALVLSIAGVVLIDLRLGLALRAAPGRTALAVGVGTAVLLCWDAVGIAAGVFVKGDSPLLIGVDLAPQLPLEEPVFLAFLCYLALVAWAGALRVVNRGSRAEAP